MQVEKFILKNFTLIRVLIAILIGVLISILLIFAISEIPWESLRYFFAGPFASKGRISNILEIAAPIILCGVAIAIAFQAEQFNIGAEGAFFMSAAVGTAVAVSVNLPPIIHWPLVLVVSALTGAVWGFIPGILKAKLGASELVSSLMLNYVAYYFALFFIRTFFRDLDAGFLVSHKLPEYLWYPQFIPGTRIHVGVIVSLVFAVGAYFYLYHTNSGLELRLTGYNKKFARFGGINVVKIIVLSQVLMGAVAGIGGIGEVMGIHHRFLWQFSPGYGWDGIIVAIIGRNHPLLIILSSFFLAYLRVGGQVLNLMADVPSELVEVIKAAIILLITAEAFLGKWKYKITRREAEREEALNEQPVE